MTKKNALCQERMKIIVKIPFPKKRTGSRYDKYRTG